MQVKDLAKQADVAAHVVRYYTEIGLLKPERDPSNRYRVFAATDIYRVKFIRRARWLGFTLNDVKAILSDADAGESPCADVRRIVRTRLAEISDKLEELRRLQARVAQAVELWDTMPDRIPDHTSLCHLIDTVASFRGDLT